MTGNNTKGEQPLLPYEACNLGSINLANFVIGSDRHNQTVDYARLSQVTSIAVRFLDDVIDMNKYPLPEIEKMCKSTRKIGLGVMGFADMLHQLEIPYGSEKSMEIARSVMQLIQETAHAESEKLASERGAYPAYYELQRLGRDCGCAFRRNAMVTTIAPTGSISAIADVSSGIEPLFANVFYKCVMDNTYLPVVNQRLLADLKEVGVWSEDLEKRICESDSIQHFEEIPEHIRQVYVCAHDIHPTAHVSIQSQFQKFVDNAISKTVNFNEAATEDDIRQAYTQAYMLGCKGITVYRNNCRKNQVLNVGTVKESAESTDTTASAASDSETDYQTFIQQVFQPLAGKSSTDIIVCIEDMISALATSQELENTVYHQLIASVLNRLISNDGNILDWLASQYSRPLGNLMDLMVAKYPKVRARSVFAEKITSTEPTTTSATEHRCNGNCHCHDKDHSAKPREIQERDDVTTGYTKCVKINCGKLYVTVNRNTAGNLFEVFSTTGKSGGCPAQSEAVCRLVSLLLRAGVTPERISRQLRGIKCMACMRNPNIKVLSCPDAIGRELKAGDIGSGVTAPTPSTTQEVCQVKTDVYHQPATVIDDRPVDPMDPDRCPQCGSEMKHVGGCQNCLHCGYSSCG